MLVLLPTLLMGLILPSVSFASDEVGIVINGGHSASFYVNINLFVRQVNLPVSEFYADDFVQIFFLHA